jgi:hypothetical protein
MAVKFSEFTEETVASNITGIVGYVASSNLNVRIAPGALNTSYDLTATDNAANNVPLVLTGSDSTADTVNFVGAGGIQLSSTGNVVTVTSDARVDSFTSSFGNYISGTNQVDATGSVSIGSVNLSAIDGTSDSTTRFLSKDNTWDLVDRGVTGSGTANIVPLWTDTTVLGDSVIAQSGTNIGIGTNTPADKLSISSSINQIGLDSGDIATYGTLDLGMFTNGAFIGTQAGSNTQSDLLRFGTSGTERMRITSTGNVGIGTTTPVAPLTVKGEAFVQEAGANGNAALRVQYGNDGDTTLRDRARLMSVGYSGTLELIDSSNILTTKINSTGDSYLNGGNVGIGTASPGAKLSVFENGSGVLFTRNSGDNGTTGPVIAFTNNSTQSIMFAVGDGLSFKTRTVGSSYLTGSEKMLIATTGQIKFNEYTSAAAFTGTAVASLAVDSSGNIITEAAASTRTKQAHTISNATTGALTLSTTPSPNTTSYVDLYISGVYQVASSYTLSGTTLTLAGGTFFPQGAAVETIALS